MKQDLLIRRSAGNKLRAYEAAYAYVCNGLAHGLPGGQVYPGSPPDEPIQVRHTDRLVIVEGVDEPPTPTVVCLCGSTRFWRTFQEQSLAETLAGRIVLSIGAASGTDDQHFGNLPREEYERVKTQLDELHMRKINLCDEVLILNVNGYIGESTARELAYARKIGRRVRFLEPVDFNLF